MNAFDSRQICQQSEQTESAVFPFWLNKTNLQTYPDEIRPNQIQLTNQVHTNTSEPTDMQDISVICSSSFRTRVLITAKT